MLSKLGNHAGEAARKLRSIKLALLRKEEDGQSVPNRSSTKKDRLVLDYTSMLFKLGNHAGKAALKLRSIKLVTVIPQEEVSIKLALPQKEEDGQSVPNRSSAEKDALVLDYTVNEVPNVVDISSIREDPENEDFEPMPSADRVRLFIITFGVWPGVLTSTFLNCFLSYM